MNIEKLLIYIFASVTCIESYTQWERTRTKDWLILTLAFFIYSINQILTYDNPASSWNHFANALVAAMLCYSLTIDAIPIEIVKKIVLYSNIVLLPGFFALLFVAVLFPDTYSPKSVQQLDAILLLWALLMYGTLTISLLIKFAAEYRYNLLIASTSFIGLNLSLFFSSDGYLPETFAFIGCLAFYSYAHFSTRSYFEQLERQNEALRNEKKVLVEIRDKIGEASSKALDLDNILHTVMTSAVWATSASAGTAFWLEKDNTLKARYIAGIFPPLEKITESVSIHPKLLMDKLKSQRIALGEGIIGQAASLRQPILIEEALFDERVNQALPDSAPISTIIAAPMQLSRQLFGVIAVINKSEKRSFTENDKSLLYSIAGQAAVEIRKSQVHEDIVLKQLREQEFEKAHQIQNGLLPKEPPRIKHLEISPKSCAAREVGGDFYDFFPYEDGKLGIAIGDVSGKGFPAALVTMILHTTLHQLATDNDKPEEIIYALNNALLDILHNNEMFITMIYGVWDANARTFTFSNAGHPRPYIIRAATRDCEIVEDGDIAIGIWPDNPTSLLPPIVLNPNDMMLLYTDGIDEAINANNEEFGVERIEKFISENSALSAPELSDKLVEELQKFVGETSMRDDYTLLVLKAL